MPAVCGAKNAALWINVRFEEAAVQRAMTTNGSIGPFASFDTRAESGRSLQVRTDHAGMSKADIHVSLKRQFSLQRRKGDRSPTAHDTLAK